MKLIAWSQKFPHYSSLFRVFIHMKLRRTKRREHFLHANDHFISTCICSSIYTRGLLGYGLTETHHNQIPIFASMAILFHQCMKIPALPSATVLKMLYHIQNSKQTPKSIAQNTRRTKFKFKLKCRFYWSLLKRTKLNKAL